MSTKDEELRKAIISQVEITRQHIITAKSFILNNFNDDTTNLLRRFLEKLEALPPEEFVIYSSVPVEPQVQQSAKFITWQVAFCEGLLGLINSGLVFRHSEHLAAINPAITWTTVFQRSGGTRSGWDFDEFLVFLPAKIRKAPSLDSVPHQSLSDDDLYLSEIGINGLHIEVEEALRDAVKCFKYELFVPCLAMLSKASEGAWVELGLSLLEVDKLNPLLSESKRDKIHEDLTSSFSSIAKKVSTVVELYDNQNIYSPLRKKSGITSNILKSVAIWSDTVRESRNAVHYGAEPSLPNSFEKVAVLLISAGQNLRTLYKLRKFAEDEKPNIVNP